MIYCIQCCLSVAEVLGTTAERTPARCVHVSAGVQNSTEHNTTVTQLSGLKTKAVLRMFSRRLLWVKRWTKCFSFINLTKEAPPTEKKCIFFLQWLTKTCYFSINRTVLYWSKLSNICKGDIMGTVNKTEPLRNAQSWFYFCEPQINSSV